MDQAHQRPAARRSGASFAADGAPAHGASGRSPRHAPQGRTLTIERIRQAVTAFSGSPLRPRWERLPSRDDADVLPRLGEIKYAREPPAQLDRRGQLAALIERLADGLGIGFERPANTGGSVARRVVRQVRSAKTYPCRDRSAPPASERSCRRAGPRQADRRGSRSRRRGGERRTWLTDQDCCQFTGPTRRSERICSGLPLRPFLAPAPVARPGCSFRLTRWACGYSAFGPGAKAK